MDCPPPIVSQTEWGARPVDRRNMTDLDPPLPEVVLIQTASSMACNSVERCKEDLRQIQTYHIDNPHIAFVDIGYNFLIGNEGTIFEGRGWDKQGAFYRGHNNFAYGIAFMGPFGVISDNRPSSAAINASVRLVNCALLTEKLNATELRIVPYSINPQVAIDFMQHPDAPNATVVWAPTDVTTAGLPDKNITIGQAETTSPLPMTTLVPLGLAIGGGVLLLAVLFAGLWHLGKRSRKNQVYTQMRGRLPLHVLHKYEINQSRVTVQGMKRDELLVALVRVCYLLDSGHYGVVFKGKLQHYPALVKESGAVPDSVEVAVKMLHREGIYGSVTSQQVGSFLHEMEMLLKTGRHVNIVNVLGIVLEDNPMIIMEYCSFGSLEKFLKNPNNVRGLVSWKHDNRNTYHTFSHEYVNDAVSKTKLDSGYAVTSVDDLISFGFQVSRGMQFVSARNIIHRDLAARNILVHSTGTVKIADFGMARQETLYTLEKSVELPMRWLALESLLPRKGTYNMKTDIWSFGVTLWEILSLCRVVPYQEDVPKGSDFVEFLLRGGRLTRPAFCSDKVYEIMRRCWAVDPNDRPTFVHLTSELSDLLPPSMQEEYITLDETNDVFNDDLDKRYEDSPHL